MKRLLREPLLLTTIIVIFAALGLFVIYPVLRVLLYPSLRDFLALPGNERYITATLHTCVIVILSTSSATVVGFLFAYTFTRTTVPLKRLFRGIAILPLFSPPFMIAFSYILMFGRNGLVTYTLLGTRYNIIGWHGLWLSQTIAFFPIAALVMEGVLQSIAPSLEYAARNLGASGWRLFWTVILPLARPGVTGAALLVAIYVLADFGNPVMIAGHYTVLPTEAWARISGWGDVTGAAVLSSLMLIPAVGLFLAQRYWVGRRQYTTITGKVVLLTPPPTPWYVRWPLFAFCTLVSLLILCVFLGLLAGAFSRGWGFDYTPTLQHWQDVLANGRALINSLVFAAAAAIISSLLAIVASYLVARKSFPGRGLLDFVSILPAAIPGVVFGIGYSLAFNAPPLDLYGTAAIIILSLMSWNIPMGYQTGTGRLKQIAPSLGEAASNLGAGSLRTFWDVELPLLKSSLVSAFVVSFIRAVTTLSVIVFLVTNRNVVATFTILNLANDGYRGAAAALTTALLALTCIVLAASRLLFGRNVELFRI
jgi:iron(III) transport system permease protein